ncbi:MAG: hypothetical protein NXY57DRAFT_963336 [Lentinula lateritia]|uniref:Uncharacterized protein n=1 Tax=Lentinula lateritia TaxID=40482 RepID=A0ABQ8VFU6_9AGAR|nr:MAG: hypothetical protein NXY57DRAFT_963336 [Lentinula lateritia]KAJ4492513.1 hypothetical protein C8R41DRAFT_919825 [Lentinula lateritia]
MSGTSSNTSNNNLPQLNSQRRVRFAEENTIYLQDTVKDEGSNSRSKTPHLQNEGQPVASSLEVQSRLVSPTAGDRGHGETPQFQHRDQSYGRPLHAQYESTSALSNSANQPIPRTSWKPLTFPNQFAGNSVTNFPLPAPEGVNVVSLPSTNEKTTENESPGSWQSRAIRYQPSPMEISSQPTPNTPLTLTSSPPSLERVDIASSTVTKDSDSPKPWQSRAPPHQASSTPRSWTFNQPPLVPQTPSTLMVSLPDIDDEEKMDEEGEQEEEQEEREQEEGSQKETLSPDFADGA